MFEKQMPDFFFKYPQNPSESNVCVDVYLLSSPAEPTQHTVIWSFEGVIRFWWYPSFAPTPKVSCFSEQNQTKLVSEYMTIISN